ncbi:hypothetical protein KJ877_10380 [bacterium]|nr:hypothetical protein [bacterium]MBU1991102.1 hypothetical protein [bacterium]
MNRSSFAFFVALLIHFVFILLFWLLGTLAPEIKSEQDTEKKIRISLKEMPPKDKISGITKEKIEKTPIAPPMPKGSQLEKLVKKPNIKFEPKEVKKQPAINKPADAPQQQTPPEPKVHPLPPKKPYIELLDEKQEPEVPLKTKPEKEKVDPLYALLSQDKSEHEENKQSKKTASGSSINQNIKELYGDEFGKLTHGQQQYILDNQEIMRRITQQVLNRVARVNLSRELNVNRSNVIEFYLHPNGDMTDFRFLKKSGYYVLDDTTKETIEYAYSRYPRPSEKTLIRYNVFYNLARY